MNRRFFLKALGLGVPAALHAPKSGLLEAFAKMLEPTRRTLKAVWTFEPARQLRAYHSLDVQAELTAYLADQIRFEIDREALSDLG